MHIALRSLVSTGAVMALASTACSTAAPTRVTDVWRDPNYASGQMTKIVVRDREQGPLSRKASSARRPGKGDGEPHHLGFFGVQRAGRP